MFCDKCGRQLTGKEAYCGRCGTPVAASGRKHVNPQGDMSAGQRLIARLLIAVSATAIASVAMLMVSAFIRDIERLVDEFAPLEAVAAGVGTATFVAFAVVIMILSAVSSIRLAKLVFTSDLNAPERLLLPLVISVLLSVLCLALWICKLVFRSPDGSDVSRVLFFTFASYGSVALACACLAGASTVLLLLTQSIMARMRG